ncbi:MAG TPA: serine/threonine-protein kinase [Gemmatimonadales bacterium]|nr:serine/threonine-protein kinase [Gemmatimonadales bacterium]
MKTVSPERWRRIEELLDGVLDLPPEQRSAWLVRACDGDEPLREAVEKLVAACEQPTRLPPSPVDLAAPLLARMAAEPEPEPAPERVGPWRMVRELGHGGMGTVYLAERDDEQFRKQVAIKILRRGIAGEDLTRRFRHERQILASLDHPNIARMLDGGMESGAPYIVMEFVDGVPLDTFCRRHQLPLNRRLELFADVCAAVQYAHQNLVVHRDLKPSNILVTDDGQVKLLDFGIAKLLEEEDAVEAAPLTRTGLRLMTPEYAAPEQVRGGLITTATDVYALGIVLYELLAGRRPYEVKGRSLSEIERVVCQSEPVRPSTAAARERAGADPLPRRLRGDLDVITLKALRKEPERRYQSVAELLDDLRRYRDGLPILARPDTFFYRARKFGGRHRVAIGVAGLALATLLAGALRERGLRAEAEAEAAKARAVKDFLVGIFQASDPYGRTPEQERAVTAQGLLDRGRERVDSALGGQPEIQGEMLSVLGGVYSNLGLYAEAAPLFERSLVLRRELFSERSAAVAESMTELADVYQRQGHYARADSLLRHALALRQDLHGRRSLEAARSLDRLATVLEQQSRYADAEPLYREALAIRTERLGPRHLDVAESMLNLSLLLYWKAEYDASEQMAREAIEIRQEQLGPRHLLVALAMHNLAQVQHARGELADAERLFRESLELKKEAFGGPHPRITVHLNNYARVLRERGKYAEAERLFREALTLDRGLFGEEHPYVAASMDNLAALLLEQGRFDEADSLFERALAVNRTLLGERSTRVALTLSNIGMLQHRRGDLARSEATYRDALLLYREIFGPDHLYVALVTGNLAPVVRDRGRLGEAEQLYRAVLAKLEAGMPRTRARLAPVLVGLGRTLVADGKAAEARPLLERGLDLFRAQYGEEDWHTAEARYGLGLALAALDRRDEAAALLRQSLTALQPFRAAQPRLVQGATAALAGLESAGPSEPR